MNILRIVLLSIAILLGLILLILIYNLVIETFTYEAEIKGKGKMNTIGGRVQLRSFLRFMKADVGYEDKNIFYRFSIFWGKLILFSSDADDKKRKTKKTNNDSDSNTKNPDSDCDVSDDRGERTYSGNETQESDVRGPEVHGNTHSEQERNTVESEEEISDIPQNGFEDDIFEDDEFKDFNPLKAKITEETPQKKSIIRTIEKIKRANLNYSLIIKNLKKILKALRIKSFEADLDYSLGAPDVTGKAVGVMSIMPFMYGNKVDMRPDFLADDVLFDGWTRVKGRFRIIALVYPALVILIHVWRRSKK